MKRFVIVVTCILLCFIFVFTCIGYAAISDTLQISGNATVTPPEAVFISGAEVVGGNATVTYSGTSLFVTGSGQVTVNITFFNNTAEVHRYNGISVIDSSIFSTYPMSISRGAEIAISGTLEATITLNITGSANGEGIVFDFVTGDSYIDNPADQFEDILNNEDSFKELEDILNDETTVGGEGQRGDTSYIQNTGNNADEVNKIVNELFDVNGESLLTDDTTVLIKRENKDDMPQGVDVMTLYFAATSEITSKEPSIMGVTENVNVRAAIFINNGEGWEQIVNQEDAGNGGMFTGEALATYYDYKYEEWWGQHPRENYDSFDTGTWSTYDNGIITNIEGGSTDIVANDDVRTIVNKYLGYY